MSTNTSVTHHQWTKFLPFVVILLAAAMILTFAFLNVQPAVRLGSAGTFSENSLQRGIDADAARYTAMAKFYTVQNESIGLGIESDAARYTSMATFYSAWRNELRQTHEADAARYTAMAEYYMGK